MLKKQSSGGSVRVRAHIRAGKKVRAYTRGSSAYQSKNKRIGRLLNSKNIRKFSKGAMVKVSKSNRTNFSLKGMNGKYAFKNRGKGFPFDDGN